MEEVTSKTFHILKAQKREDLNIVCVQDFEDDYHKDIYDPSDKLLSRVRMIRRRYKTTFEYQYAVNIINTYIAKLMIKYGGEDKFISLLRAELIDEYLPPIPRMKGGAKNKQLIKSGIIATSATFKRLDVERLDELRAKYSRINPEKEDNIVFVDRDHEGVEEVNKVIEKKGVTVTSVSYVKTQMSLDLFEEYFQNRKAKKKVQEEEPESDITMRDILDPNYHKNVVDVGEEQDEFIPHRGGFIHRDDVETVENIGKLGNLGWDKVKLARRVKGSKNIMRLTANESKKERKRRKKREAAGNAFLLGLAGQSDKHSTFGDFEEAMLDFTSAGKYDK